MVSNGRVLIFIEKLNQREMVRVSQQNYGPLISLDIMSVN